MTTNRERALFWEKTAKEAQTAAAYYQRELEKAHALLGRVVHQASERWDSINLTKYFPTDNLHHHRTIGNPGGNRVHNNRKDSRYATNEVTETLPSED